MNFLSLACVVVSLGVTVLAHEFRGTAPADGQDAHIHCCYWAATGKCESNIYWMRPYCQKSCGTSGCKVEDAQDCEVTLDVSECTKPLPQPDSNEFCCYWASRGECDSNMFWMRPNCQASCGTPQCLDSNEFCCYWALIGEVDSYMFLMRPNCQTSCDTLQCIVNEANKCKVTVNTEGCPFAQDAAPPPVATYPQLDDVAKPPAIRPPLPEPCPPVAQPACAVGCYLIPQMNPANGCVQSYTCSKPEAKDSNEHCCYWASKGKCDSNPFWMRPNCQKACGTKGCTVENALDCFVTVDPECGVQKKPANGVQYRN